MQQVDDMNTQPNYDACCPLKVVISVFALWGADETSPQPNL